MATSGQRILWLPFPLTRRVPMRASLGFLGLVAASLTGCAIMAVGSDFNPNTDFSAYRTFGWEAAESLPTGDARLDDNPFFDERVRRAVEREMVGKGLEMGAAGEPGLVLHYHFSIEHRIDVYGLDEERGYTSSERRAGGYDEGTLLIDIADASTHRIIWRGWARLDVTGVLDDRERLDRRVDEAVRKILERFPPG